MCFGLRNETIYRFVVMSISPTVYCSHAVQDVGIQAIEPACINATDLQHYSSIQPFQRCHSLSHSDSVSWMIGASMMR